MQATRLVKQQLQVQCTSKELRFPHSKSLMWIAVDLPKDTAYFLPNCGAFSPAQGLSLGCEGSLGRGIPLLAVLCSGAP